jgi:lysophospholipase L1-like esterase
MGRALVALALALVLLFAVQIIRQRMPWLQDHTKGTTFFEEAPQPTPAAAAAPAAVPSSSSGTAAVRALFRDLERGRRKKLRILYYADSLTEGGVLTDTLRADLQARYGGLGPGYQGMAPRDASDRSNLVLRPDKTWLRLGLRGSKPDQSAALGPPGEAYRVEGGASAGLRLAAPSKEAQHWYQHAVLFAGPGAFRLDASTPSSSATLNGHGKGAFNAYRVSLKPAPSLQLRVSPRTEGMLFYGVSLDSDTGVQLDNFTLRGNLGDGPAAIPGPVLKQAQATLHWDLVILEFGLNALSPEQTKFQWYRADLRRTLRHLKQQLHGATFVVVSVLDHSVKGPAGMVSDPSIPYLMDAQAKAAADEGAAFVDIFHAMGGAGSMQRWVEDSPSMAYKDYLHPTRRGGAVLARLLEKELLPETVKPGGQP